MTDLLTTQKVRDLASHIQFCLLAKDQENRTNTLRRLWVQARELGITDLVEIELFSRSRTLY